MSELSRGLKILARELDTPVMCLSQLNRQLEYRQDKRPMLADLRESGCLTADTELTLADGTTVTMGALYDVRRARTSRCSRSTSTCGWCPACMTHVFASGVKECSSCGWRRAARVTASAQPPVPHRRRLGAGRALAPGARIASTRPTGRASTRAATRSRRAVWDYIEQQGPDGHGHARPRPRRPARRRRGLPSRLRARRVARR